jgi:hypothetical protein
MIGLRAGTAVVALTLLCATATAPAEAAPEVRAATTGSGWVPAPSAPADRAAGVLCDFAIHAEPIVDEVMTKTLSTYPDGTAHRGLYAGRLVVRVTNVETGASYDADASGDSVYVRDLDGTVTWYAVGPALVGFQPGQGNLPRGFYLLDGVYRLTFSPDGHRTLTPAHGRHEDVCHRID